MVLGLLDVLSYLSKDEMRSNMEKQQIKLRFTTFVLKNGWKSCVLCASQPG